MNVVNGDNYGRVVVVENDDNNNRLIAWCYLAKYERLLSSREVIFIQVTAFTTCNSNNT